MTITLGVGIKAVDITHIIETTTETIGGVEIEASPFAIGGLHIETWVEAETGVEIGLEAFWLSSIKAAGEEDGGPLFGVGTIFETIGERFLRLEIHNQIVGLLFGISLFVGGLITNTQIVGDVGEMT